jgi:DNA-binding response OmpR family regulator
VLVIDDEDSARRGLAIGLELDGFEVVLADSIPEAFDVLGSMPPIDVVLIDLMMPDVNGLELTRRIRRSFPQVRVVLTSAYHLSARQVERANCGAVGFVPKPYKLSEVCTFLRAKARTARPAAI